MTDFRALCAELVDAIDSGISTNRMHLSPVMLRARAALAQADPQWPTNKEIDELALELLDGDRASTRDFTRAVLARWGRPKPPSLKKQALADFNWLIGRTVGNPKADARSKRILQALESLSDD